MLGNLLPRHDAGWPPLTGCQLGRWNISLTFCELPAAFTFGNMVTEADDLTHMTGVGAT